jgi:hypothetical protein
MQTVKKRRVYDITRYESRDLDRYIPDLGRPIYPPTIINITHEEEEVGRGEETLLRGKVISSNVRRNRTIRPPISKCPNTTHP